MNLDDLEGLSEEEVLRLYENMNGQTITGTGPGRVPQPNLSAPSEDEIAANHPAPKEKPEPTTSYKYEPDRPRFGPWENVAMEAGINPKTHQSFEDDDIQALLKRLEDAQETDRGHTQHDRRAAYALNAGEAMSAGFANRPGKYMDIPKHEDESKGAMDYINSSDKLNNSKHNWKNKEQDRELKDILKRLEERGKDTRLESEQKRKNDDREDKQEWGTDEKTKDRGLKSSEGDKTRAANLARPIISATIASGNHGARADAEFANKQAERQLMGWEDLGPHTATENSKAGHIAGSEAAIQVIGRKMVDAMRKNGRNFPGSTEWIKLQSEMNNIREEFNKAHENGVMNFGDMDNRIRETGDPQGSFIQYAMDNGPDILENALNNMAAATDAKMGVMKYKRNPNAKLRNPSEFMKNSSGGGNRSSPLQDPNTLPEINSWVKGGGTGSFPNLRDPGETKPKAGAMRSHWDPVRGAMIDDATGEPI